KMPTTVCIEVSFVLPSSDRRGAQTWGRLRCLAPRRVLTHPSLRCSSMLQQFPCQAEKRSMQEVKRNAGRRAYSSLSQYCSAPIVHRGLACAQRPIPPFTKGGRGGICLVPAALKSPPPP